MQKLPEVILLDDDKQCLQTLARALELRGFNVKTCEQPLELKRSIKISTGQIVIIDHRLRGIDMEEFIRELNNYEVEIIIVTGFREELSLSEFEQVRINQVYDKPVDVNELAAEIKEIRSRQRSGIR